MTVSVHLKKISSEEHLSKAFRYFDRDGSGYIEIDELREALAEGDPGPNEQAIQEIFSDVDVDKVQELTQFGSYEFTYKKPLSYLGCNWHISICRMVGLVIKNFR